MTASPATGVRSSAEELLSLHRKGRLAEEYPRVRHLLSDVPAAELDRAGRLLARLDVDEVVRAHPDQATITVAVTGNSTLSGLLPPLTAELARHGLLLRPVLTGFADYRFALSDQHGALYRADPDLVACLLDGRVVTEELPTPWTVADVETALETKVAALERLADTFATRARGVLVLNTLPVPPELAAALIDYRSRARLGAVWRAAMARLLRLAEDRGSVVVFDLDPLIADVPSYGDPRLAVYGRQNLSPALLARYAGELGHLARHLTGRTKKCLVLDLDHTIWHGILAETGPTGVDVGDTPEGEVFAAVQKTAAQLSSQGVLLAAVSKNDLAEVRQVFADHPAMVLREDDFVQIIANWDPKHDNLRGLAATLNLGLDSFVFADDSGYERGLVRHELPEVAVVDLDDEPAGHVPKLLRDSWFAVHELTGEDRARAQVYRQETSRKDFLSAFSSLEDYLRELGIVVELASAGEAQAARVSQLSLRTNQFNLTTERLQPQDIHALLADPAALVYTIKTSDRFGNNGTVGAVLCHRDGDSLQIDNFLLSCRVFSRGIEQACLSAILRHARSAGLRTVRATYRPTAKNGKARDFYPRYGFSLEFETSDEVIFRHDLADVIGVPEHVRLVDQLERTAS